MLLQKENKSNMSQAIPLSVKDIKTLRESGRVMQHESAIKEADMFFAVNSTTGERRIISTTGLVLEASRSLLLD